VPLEPLSDAKVLDSWHTNAAPWTEAVRGGAIESRRLVTDRAVLDAVLERAPRRALDVGCGEGWLVRALGEAGVRAAGVDAVPALVERARAAGGGAFHVASYETLAAAPLAELPDDLRDVDVVVANFALIGEAAVDALVRRVPALLRPGGAFVLQTLHPLVAAGDLPYADGWRPGSWAGFSDAFRDPAPWYFRTVESWVRLLVDAGLHLLALREPLHPRTGRPASILFVAAR
jgi:SAM-dependent methyltransferase